MRVHDDRGELVDADFDLVLDETGTSLSIGLHSAGGGAAAGQSRNPGYASALAHLLRRLGGLEASLDDVLVDSAQARKEPMDARRVHPTPWHLPVALSAVGDFEALRLAMTRPQKDIASSATAGGGNERKRLLLQVSLPTSMPIDAVAHALGAVSTSSPGPSVGAIPAEVREDATTMLRRLMGEDLETLTGHPNRILGVTPPNVLVATETSPEGQAIPIAAVEAALEALRTRGFFDLRPGDTGPNTAFIGAVLSTLPGTETTLNPARISIGRAHGEPASERTITHEGASDRPATRLERLEQSKVRSVLLGGSEQAACALCGETYPVRFLWASHIKTRNVCSEAERKDLGNVAILACLFGCDVLFEHGYVSVDQDGFIHASRRATESSSLAERISNLSGRRCLAHNAGRASYFEWHRENRYLGD